MNEASGPSQREPAVHAAKVGTLGTPFSESRYADVLLCLDQAAIEPKLLAHLNVHPIPGLGACLPSRRTHTRGYPLGTRSAERHGAAASSFDARRRTRVGLRLLAPAPTTTLPPSLVPDRVLPLMFARENVRWHAKSGHRD
jgi:hypothetical protein